MGQQLSHVIEKRVTPCVCVCVCTVQQFVKAPPSKSLILKPLSLLLLLCARCSFFIPPSSINHFYSSSSLTSTFSSLCLLSLQFFLFHHFTPPLSARSSALSPPSFSVPPVYLSSFSQSLHFSISLHSVLTPLPCFALLPLTSVFLLSCLLLYKSSSSSSVPLALPALPAAVIR